MLQILNTVTGKKELLNSRNKKITMYVCGVTPYDHSHIGHGRCYVAFDVVYRFLKFLGYSVTYCRNFTDIDDKLLKKATEIYNDKTKFSTIANEYIDLFHRDMCNLNCLSPDIEPKVTDNIPAIIKFIESLIEKGFAYESEGDVYFSIKNFPQYGALSKQDIDDLRSGVRIDVRTQKNDPLDFALWKHEPVDTFWDSPWGNGRPGWHIECSALAHTFLGETIDIHGGGLDLQFPHHENEIAQSESLLEKTFARIWMHNGLVKSNKEKMSKSLGNVSILHTLFQTFDPMVIRYYLLTHHYRAPIEFNTQDVHSVQKAYIKLCDAFPDASVLAYENIKTDPLAHALFEYLNDDFNVPGMIGYIFKHLPETKDNLHSAAIIKTILTSVLGLTLKPLANEAVEITPDIQKMLDEREQARENKEWARADEIRNLLLRQGIVVHDKKN